MRPSPSAPAEAAGVLTLGGGPNLFDFFLEQVDATVADRGAHLSADGVYYLSKLLAERGHVGELEAPRTLVELHLQAAQGDHGQQVRCYKDLGDQALVVSGYFDGTLRRSTVGVDYYVSMGRAAYDRLARLLGYGVRQSNGLDVVFAELADTFSECVGVLREVRDGMRAEQTELDDAALLALYEQYQRTGSRRALRRLQAMGLAPMPRGRSAQA